MPSIAIIALCAMTIGIAISGALCTFRTPEFGPKAHQARTSLLGVYVLLAMLASAPLVLAYSLALYHFFVPAILPALLALPSILVRFVIVRTAVDEPPPVHWRDLILPGSGALVMIGYWTQPLSTKVMMLEQGELPEGLIPAALALATFVLLLLWVMASLGYLALAIRHLRGFRVRLKDFHSNTETRELRWIDWFMGFLVLIWAAAALSLIGENTPLGFSLPSEIVISLIAALLLFLMAFAPTGLNRDPRVEPDESETAQPETSTKYARTAMSKDHAKRLAQRIDTAMHHDTLYLDPNLSLQKLARHVGALPNHTSQVLNEEIGSTFFDYVARWRVEAAKPLIASGEVTVLAAALDVGFNSRSTFYTAFKRETGMTPKAFRDGCYAVLE